MLDRIMTMSDSWLTKDIVDLLKLFNEDKYKEFNKHIQEHSKLYIAQEIESISIKEIITLLELFKGDY
jgi:hypothetical protein